MHVTSIQNIQLRKIVGSFVDLSISIRKRLSDGIRQIVRVLTLVYFVQFWEIQRSVVVVCIIKVMSLLAAAPNYIMMLKAAIGVMERFL